MEAFKDSGPRRIYDAQRNVRHFFPIYVSLERVISCLIRFRTNDLRRIFRNLVIRLQTEVLHFEINLKQIFLTIADDTS